MTQQQQIEHGRIAIAERCGWRLDKHQNMWYVACPDDTTYGVGLRGWQHDGDGYCTKESAAKDRLPNYYGNLDAMHEAEKTLTGAEGGDYDLYLWLAIQRDGSRPASWHATAPQRFESFLRTIGKWKE